MVATATPTSRPFASTTGPPLLPGFRFPSIWMNDSSPSSPSRRLDTDALPTVNINAVAVDPTSPAHVFMASPAGIFGSNDGGHVWTPLTQQDLSPRGTRSD